MAGWRLYLADETIRRLDIVGGKRPVLAAWTRPGRVFFLDASSANPLGEQAFTPVGQEDRAGEAWRSFTQGLTGPNGETLPYVPLPGMTLQFTQDGASRLLRMADGALYLDVNGQEARVSTDGGASWVVLGLDRQTGVIAALDADGKLQIYRQHVGVMGYDTGLMPDDDLGLYLAVADGGSAVFASDGRTVVRVDSSGNIVASLALHYEPGLMTCSPDGRWLAVTDREIGVIRIYAGADLTLSRQRFASDLLAEARRVQLIGGPPNLSTGLSAITLSNKGVLAFAADGQLCVSSVARMGLVPQV